MQSELPRKLASSKCIFFRLTYNALLNVQRSHWWCSVIGESVLLCVYYTSTSQVVLEGGGRGAGLAPSHLTRTFDLGLSVVIQDGHTNNIRPIKVKPQVSG